MTGYQIHGNFGKKFRMKKLFYLIFLFPLLFHHALFSQGVSIYSPSRQTGITFSSISLSGNTISSWRAGTNTSDNRSFPVYLGFTFNYLGMPYNQVSISLNGFIDFSSSSATGATPGPYSSNNTTFSQTAPNSTYLAIAPMYDDINCASGATLNNSIRYRSAGTSGNRIFTVEWINMTFASGTSDHLNFQVKLYEADSKIEFIYGTMTLGTGSPGYTSGINASSISNPPEYTQLLTQQSPNSINFTNNPQNSLSVLPESNSMITLTGCLLPLPAGTITGLSSACEGTSGLTYTVSAISGATGYDWTVPADFVITNGFNTNSITVTVEDGANTGVISVSGSNSCGNGVSSSMTMTVKPRPTPTIIGPSPVCVGATGQVYSTQTGMTNYQWTVSSGGTVTSGGTTSSSSVTVTWNNTSTQYVSVNYTGSNGCAGAAPTSYPVTVYPIPVPSISGPNIACINSNGNVYTTQPGMTNYAWTVSTGGVITSGGSSSSNTATVQWNLLGAHNVTVNYVNSSGCSAPNPASYPVTVTPLPVPTISGSTTSCINSIDNVYSTQSGMTGYNWTVSSGGTITSGINTNSIIVTWSTTGVKTVTVNYTNANGCTATSPASFSLNVYTRPTPTITGPATLCEGTTTNTYTTQAGMASYQWTVTSGGTITSGAGTNSIIVTWNSPGAQAVTVNYNNSSGCPAINPTYYAVTVNPRPTPTITGPASVCEGSTGKIYSTQTGMSNYTWTVSAGGTITAGGGPTNSTVTVTWNTSGAQDVSVNYANATACTAAAPEVYPVTVNTLPLPSITGPDSVCVNTIDHGYKTESGMSNYTWTVSSGGVITAGVGTDSITVSWNAAGAKTVSVNYTNSNGCIASPPTVLDVTVNPLPVPVINGYSSTCIGIAGYIYTTEPGMTDYNWTISSGGTIDAGLGTNTITVTWNVTGAQTLSVSYTNANGCATANPSVKNITVNDLPVPTITGNNTPCVNSGNHPYSTQTGMSNYQWTISSAGIIISGAGTNQIMVNWVSSGAQWVKVNYTNAAGCDAASPANYDVNVITAPTTPGSISGTPSLCVPASGVAYHVDSIPYASIYVWGLPPGAVIETGSGTNNITVGFSSTATSGNITVSGTNNCGSGSTSPPFYVYATTFLPTPFIQQGGDWLYSDQMYFNQWYFEGNLIPDATSQYYLATSDGWYFDIAMNNSCISDTSNWIYVIITGIDKPDNEKITIYPVPNDGKFTASFNMMKEETFSLVIYNSLGLRIKEMDDIHVKNKTELSVALPGADPGIYSVVFQNDTRRIVKRILVTR